MKTFIDIQTATVAYLAVLQDQVLQYSIVPEEYANLLELDAAQIVAIQGQVLQVHVATEGKEQFSDAS